MKLNQIKGKIKRILAVSLALTIVSTSVSMNQMMVHAEDEVAVQEVEESPQESTDTKNQEEGKPEESITEDIKAEEPKTEDTKTEETTKEDGSTTEVVEDQNISSEDIKEDINKKEEVVEEDITVSENEIKETVSENIVVETVSENKVGPVRLTIEINGVRIVATADAGVLPEDAELKVEEITTTKAIERAVEGTVTTAEEVQEIKSYDIRIMSKGEEIQPEDGTVSITFEGIQVESHEKVAVVYTSDDASAVEKQDTEVSGSKVSFEAEHFSIYNIVITTIVIAEEVPIYVGYEGYTNISLDGFDGETIAISNENPEIVDAYLTDNHTKLKLGSLRKAGVAKVTLKDKDRKASYLVHVQNKPSMTADAFKDAFAVALADTETILPFSKMTLQASIDEQFKNRDEARIDSSAINSLRTRAIMQAMELKNTSVQNFSFQYAKAKEAGKTVYYLYYSPMDISVYTKDQKAREVISKNGLEQYVQATVFKCVDGEWTKLSGEKLYSLEEKSHGGSDKLNGQPVTIAEYKYLVLGTGMKDTVEISKEGENATFTLTYEVHDSFKAEYDLMDGIAGRDHKQTVSVEQSIDNRITGFGVVLTEKQKNERIASVVMTLAEDVTGTKDNKIVKYPKGTVVSKLDKGNAKVDYDSGFGFTYFRPGTEVKLLVSPASFNVKFVNDDGTVLSNQNITNTAEMTVPSENSFYTATGGFADKATADKYSRFQGWKKAGSDVILTSKEASEANVTADTTYTAVYETIAQFNVKTDNGWKKLVDARGSNIGVIDDSVYTIYKNSRLNVGAKGFTREDMKALIKEAPAEKITINGNEYDVIPYSLVKEQDGWHVDYLLMEAGQYQVVYLDRNGAMIATAMVSSQEEENSNAPDRSKYSYTEKNKSFLYEFDNWRREAKSDEPVILAETYELTKIFANVYALNRDVVSGTITEENLSEILGKNPSYIKAGQVELDFDKVKDLEENSKLVFGNSNILASDGYVTAQGIADLGVNGSVANKAIEELAKTYTGLNFDAYTMEWYIVKNYKTDGFHIDGVAVARPVVTNPPTDDGTTTDGGTTGTATTPVTTSTTQYGAEIAPANVVIPDAPVALAAVPGNGMENTVLQNNGNGTITPATLTTLEEEDVPQAAVPGTEDLEGTDTITIPEEEVALAPRYVNDCAAHWMILLLTFAYSVFALIRAFARHKEISEIADCDTENANA